MEKKETTLFDIVSYHEGHVTGRLCLDGTAAQAHKFARDHSRYWPKKVVEVRLDGAILAAYMNGKTHATV